MQIKLHRRSFLGAALALPMQTRTGAGPNENPASGDVCYFAPWGNLALYRRAYGNYPGLIRPGKLDGGPAPLLKQGTFPLQITVSS